MLADVKVTELRHKPTKPQHIDMTENINITNDDESLKIIPGINAPSIANRFTPQQRVKIWEWVLAERRGRNTMALGGLNRIATNEVTEETLHHCNPIRKENIVQNVRRK